jgi:hypothetical protein
LLFIVCSFWFFVHLLILSQAVFLCQLSYSDWALLATLLSSVSILFGFFNHSQISRSTLSAALCMLASCQIALPNDAGCDGAFIATGSNRSSIVIQQPVK